MVQLWTREVVRLRLPEPEARTLPLTKSKSRFWRFWCRAEPEPRIWHLHRLRFVGYCADETEAHRIAAEQGLEDYWLEDGGHVSLPPLQQA